MLSTAQPTVEIEMKGCIRQRCAPVVDTEVDTEIGANIDTAVERGQSVARTSGCETDTWLAESLDDLKSELRRRQHVVVGGLKRFLLPNRGEALALLAIIVVVVGGPALAYLRHAATDKKRRFGKKSYVPPWQDARAARINVRVPLSPAEVAPLIEKAMNLRRVKTTVASGVTIVGWSHFFDWDTLASWRPGGREFTTVATEGPDGVSDVSCYCRSRFAVVGTPLTQRFSEDEVSRLAANLVARADRVRH